MTQTLGLVWQVVCYEFANVAPVVPVMAYLGWRTLGMRGVVSALKVCGAVFGFMVCGVFALA